MISIVFIVFLLFSIVLRQWNNRVLKLLDRIKNFVLLDSLSQLVTHSRPKCKFSLLNLFSIKNYRNLIISLVLGTYDVIILKI